jgi:hypothetical protein
MREKPRGYPIVWRKPPLEGPPSKATRPPIHVFNDAESSKFYRLIVIIIAAAPLLLMLLQILDGRWWKGDISGTVALSVGLPVFGMYLFAIGWAWRLHRKGKARADALKIRRIDAPESEFQDRPTPVLILKLIASLILPILFGLIFWKGLNRLLAGLPFSDTAQHQHYYRRYRYEIWEKYIAPHFPIGPIFSIVMMVFLAVIIAFLIWHTARETRKLLRKSGAVTVTRAAAPRPRRRSP